MYTHIQKIVIKNRIHLQIGFFKKIFQKFGIKLSDKKIYLIRTLFDFLSSILLIPSCFYMLSYVVSKDVLIPVLFIVVGILGIAKGIENYKNIFIPPFSQWCDIAPVKTHKLFLSLLVIEILFSFILNGNLIAFVVCIFVLQGFSISAIIQCTNLVLFLMLMFLASNVICGRYNYSLITKRINFFRLLIYIVNCFLILTILNQIVNMFYNTIFLSFNTSDFDFFSDDSWITVVELIKNSIGEYYNSFIENLIICNNYINIYSLLIEVFFILLILSMPVKFISLSKKHNNYFDLLNLYIIFLTKLSKINLIGKHFLHSLQKYRWNIVKPIFQIIFLNYEAVFYIGIIVPILPFIDNIFIKIHLMIVLNIQVLSNQAFEIRQMLASFFSFSSNKQELMFLKLYFGKFPITKEKKKIMNRMLIIPVSILFFLNICCFIINSIPIVFIFFIILIDILYLLINSRIQTHMLGSTANFNVISENFIDDSFEETDLADTLQGIPRNFTNIVPMLFTIPTILFGNYSLYFVLVEIIYIIVVVPLVNLYCNKIEFRGEKSLYEKIT